MVGLRNNFETIRKNIMFVMERMITDVRIRRGGEGDTGAGGETSVFINAYGELADCAANIDSRAAVTSVFIYDQRTQ